MSTPDPAKTFQTLLKKLKPKAEPEAAAPIPQEDRAAFDRAMLELLVQSFMLWEASAAQARAAMKRLQEAFVDSNELRIALPHETAKALGERYPLAAERCLRLKAALQDLFRREHVLTLAPLLEASKREARAYLESIDGVPPYVSARMVALGLSGHAVPADWRLVDLLTAHRALPAEHAEPGAASAWIERQVRASEAAGVGAALQAWSDEHGESPKFDRTSSTGPVAMAELAVCARPRAKKAGKRPVKRPADRSPGKPRSK